MSKTRPYTISMVLWILLSLGSFAVSWYYAPLPSLMWHALVGVSAGTFFLYGFDKFFAMHKFRRIPERVLYIAAFFGGSLGALLGMHVFRHKTRKAGFQFVLAILIMLQVLIVFAIADRI